MTFSYDIFEQYVGSTSGKKHTTASYLKTITDVLGRTVKFYYQDKSYSANGPREYQAAHNEHGTTGVYQDKFEARYLDYIAAFDLNGTDTLATTRFAYHPLQYLNGNYDLAKRYLKSITQYVAGRKAAPALVFDYYFNTSDTHYGALKTITYPEGGTVTYAYSSQTLTKSDRRQLNINAPAGGSRPRVWMAEDYVVVTWYFDIHHTANQDSVQIHVYQWDGRWIGSGRLDSFGGLNILGDPPFSDQQNFEIIVERDFFAVLVLYYTETEDKPFFVYHKNPDKPGAWHKYYKYLQMTPTSNPDGQKAYMTAGKNFLAIVSQKDAFLHRFRWNENTRSWNDLQNNLVSARATDERCSLAGLFMIFLTELMQNQKPASSRQPYPYPAMVTTRACAGPAMPGSRSLWPRVIPSQTVPRGRISSPGETKAQEQVGLRDLFSYPPAVIGRKTSQPLKPVCMHQDRLDSLSRLMPSTQILPVKVRKQSFIINCQAAGATQPPFQDGQQMIPNCD